MVLFNNLMSKCEVLLKKSEQMVCYFYLINRIMFIKCKNHTFFHLYLNKTHIHIYLGAVLVGCCDTRVNESKVMHTYTVCMATGKDVIVFLTTFTGH